MSSHEDPGDRHQPAHFAGMTSPFMQLDVDTIPKHILERCERGYKPWWGERS